MKYLTLLTLFAGLTFISCKDEPVKPTMNVRVLLDYTEGQTYEDIDFDKVLSLAPADYRVKLVTIQPLRATSYQEVEDVRLDLVSHNNSSIQKKMQKASDEDAAKDFQKIVANMNTTFGGKAEKHSNIIAPLNDTYKLMKPNDVILIFSDFLENIPNANFRRMTDEQVYEHIGGNLMLTDCTVLGVLSIGRDQDDKQVRRCLKQWETVTKTNGVQFSTVNNF